MAKTTAKTIAATKPANVFAKPAPSEDQAPVADIGQGAPVGDENEGADFTIDGEDEVQKEKPAEEPVAPKAPAPSPVKPGKPARKAVAPSIDGEDEIDGPKSARKLSEEERNAVADARLRQSQNEAVENAKHIAALSRIGADNVRCIRLKKLAARELAVRELIAENEALKAENAALKNQ